MTTANAVDVFAMIRALDERLKQVEQDAQVQKDNAEKRIAKLEEETRQAIAGANERVAEANRQKTEAELRAGTADEAKIKAVEEKINAETAKTEAEKRAAEAEQRAVQAEKRATEAEEAKNRANEAKIKAEKTQTNDAVFIAKLQAKVNSQFWERIGATVKCVFRCLFRGVEGVVGYLLIDMGVSVGCLIPAAVSSFAVVNGLIAVLLVGGGVVCVVDALVSEETMDAIRACIKFALPIAVSRGFSWWKATEPRAGCPPSLKMIRLS